LDFGSLGCTHAKQKITKRNRGIIITADIPELRFRDFMNAIAAIVQKNIKPI
jgi:hypothetical protein